MIKTLWTNRAIETFPSRRWLKLWAKRLYRMPGLVTILLSRSIWTKRGATLGPMSIVTGGGFPGNMRNLVVGNQTAIAKSASISLHGTVVIGSNVVINGDVRILTGTHSTQDPQWRQVSATVKIDDYAWIAERATILPGTTIGKGAVVGAGAVVSGNVAPYSIVVGNPARAVPKTRIHQLSYNPVAQVSQIEAWLGT